MGKSHYMTRNKINTGRQDFLNLCIFVFYSHGRGWPSTYLKNCSLKIQPPLPTELKSFIVRQVGLRNQFPIFLFSVLENYLV